MHLNLLLFCAYTADTIAGLCDVKQQRKASTLCVSCNMRLQCERHLNMLLTTVGSSLAVIVSIRISTSIGFSFASVPNLPSCHTCVTDHQSQTVK